MNSSPDIKALYKKTQVRVQGHKWFQYCRLGLLLSAGFIWLWGLVQYDEFLLNVCFLSFMGCILAGVLEPKLHHREDRLLWEEVAQVEGVMLIPLVLDLLASQATPPKSVDTSALMERFFFHIKAGQASSGTFIYTSSFYLLTLRTLLKIRVTLPLPLSPSPKKGGGTV